MKIFAWPRHVCGLDAHNANPVCAGCHKITDPIGLALENFDGSGGFRVTDNGNAIDPSGNLSGQNFNSVGEFIDIIYNDTVTTSCLNRRLASYALGRSPMPSERQWIESLDTFFEESGYRVTDLMREIALSDALLKVTNVEISTALNTVTKGAF